jgi:hypothetical protein
VDCIVLHCSAGTVECECFHYGLHCWWGHVGRLQPAEPSARLDGCIPQCTRGAWAGHIPAHTWRLGSVGLGTSGTWVMTSDSRGIGRASGPMINGSSVRTQFYWVLHQDSMFMGLRILNIIIYFRNIIIFIIINIINKIINKFERKSYYLYYNFFWHFL